jgi:hypothetical protein
LQKTPEQLSTATLYLLKLLRHSVVRSRPGSRVSCGCSIAQCKDVEPKIAVDRSKLRVIDPAEGNRIDYYMGLINDLFVNANKASAAGPSEGFE